MEESVGKLGIIDFFNVLFASCIFMIGFWWLFPNFFELYGEFKNDYEKEAYVGIIIIAFFIGLILQQFGSFLDQKCFHIKSNVIENFLKLSNLKEVTKSNDIIDNDIKFAVYRNYGKSILKNKGIDIEKDFDEQQCKFVYAYCVYYTESKGKNGKYEKMRGLFDLSRTLVGVSEALAFLGFIKCILSIILWQKISCLWISTVQIFVFMIIESIFYKRAEKIMKYKARMLMEVYDICMENDNRDCIENDEVNKKKSLTKAKSIIILPDFDIRH